MTPTPESNYCKALSTCSSSARCSWGPTHGHAIARQIQRMSEDLLQVETGSLYPALHRLEVKGWIAASWELSDKGKRARFYRLTASGRRQLARERSKWETFSRAVGLILNPIDQEGS